MPFGKGKYDELCTYVRTKARAQGAVVIVFGGTLGSGFSCQADALTTINLPEILEDMAKQIRRMHAAQGN